MIRIGRITESLNLGITLSLPLLDTDTAFFAAYGRNCCEQAIALKFRLLSINSTSERLSLEIIRGDQAATPPSCKPHH